MAKLLLFRYISEFRKPATTVAYSLYKEFISTETDYDSLKQGGGTIRWSKRAKLPFRSRH